MLPSISIIVDAETTSTRPNARVTDFAALIFDHRTKQVVDHIQVFFDVNSQTGHLDPETMKWREENNLVIMEPSCFSNHQTLSKFLNFVHDFTEKETEFGIYANGSNFDFPILQSLIHDVNLNAAEGKEELKTKWNFHKEMCLRSIAMALFTKEQYKQAQEVAREKTQHVLNTIEHSSPRVAQKHNSFHDCIFEVWMVDACYEKLKSI